MSVNIIATVRTFDERPSAGIAVIKTTIHKRVVVSTDGTLVLSIEEAECLRDMLSEAIGDAKAYQR